jgi:trans-aconitate 2-methyltransferase
VRSWEPSRYLHFDDHRARPFHDLLARVGAPSAGAAAPRRVVDLGCGPGHLTGVLAARWPGAVVQALDGSADMVAAARERGVDAQLCDVVDWVPQPDTDVVVTNAVLHWVPDHPHLLPVWLGALPPGAWFALQVPGNHAAPAHALAAELLDEPPWRGAATLDAGSHALSPERYAELLAGTGAAADVWESTYLQRLTGADPVLEWISSTTLRPVRAALGGAGWAAYRAALAPRLRAAYPARPDGSTWFPFRRVFAVAHTR